MEVFGTLVDGSIVHRLTISGGGLTANILTYGTIIQDLRFEGHDAPLVLGFEDFAPYLTESPYFGATAGRCANRIRDGHVELEGETYQLDLNFPKDAPIHALHGGSRSMGKRIWQIQDHGADFITLTIELKDGEMGYPGNMTAFVTYHLKADGVLDIQMKASSDQTTLCNMAHHSYFNLGTDTISNHKLKLVADYYLPVDSGLIPTGEIRPVHAPNPDNGANFDFRDWANISQAKPVDHNFCLSDQRQDLRAVAWLKCDETGLNMEIKTTEPGLQVYDGANINITAMGLMGKKMGAHAGIALEPQIWPDANHHKGFPQAILQPDETYFQQTQYIFNK